MSGAQIVYERLLAEAKRLQAAVEMWKVHSACSDDRVRELEIERYYYVCESKRWKAKAIEERTKSMYPFDGVFTWTDLPEDDRVDKDCPIVTIWGKTHWRNAAARELEEEMRDER